LSSTKSPSKCSLGLSTPNTVRCEIEYAASSTTGPNLPCPRTASNVCSFWRQPPVADEALVVELDALAAQASPRCRPS
jgi:hypothetical protein